METPSFLLHRGTADALLSERQYLGIQIVTHEIKFVPVILFGWMNGYFRRRKREDQPPVAGVHG
jgi:hypothetical protein